MIKSGILTVGFLLACSVYGNIVIESPHETNWGDWQAWDRCPFGRYAQAMQLKTEPYQGGGISIDDTAANAIRLYCGDPSNISTSIITSGQASWGQFGSVFSCRSDGRPLPPDGYITGFQLRVESNQGLGDDTATNNLRVFCSYPGMGVAEQTVEADGLTFGSWTTARRCNSNQAICALQTQLEPYQGDSDDTALNNIAAECCDR